MGARLTRARLVALRLLGLAALFPIGALLTELLFAGSFCGATGGCARVAASEYARPFGVPLPIVGLVLWSGFLALTFVPWVRRGYRLPLLSLSAGVSGAVLIGLQLMVLDAVCPWCVAVDGIAVLVGIVGASGRLEVESPAAPGPIAAPLIAVALLAAPLAHGALGRPPAPPEVIQTALAEGAEIVEVVDFGCPHCRELHPRLSALVPAETPVARWVVSAVPHPRGRLAALAHRCAMNQDRGDAMAAYLFTPAFTEAALPEWAETAGLSTMQLEACMRSRETQRAMSDDGRRAIEAEVRGLPTLYIGPRKLDGAVPDITLRLALLAASLPGAGIPVWALVLGSVLWVSVVLGLSVRRARRAAAE